MEPACTTSTWGENVLFRCTSCGMARPDALTGGAVLPTGVSQTATFEASSRGPERLEAIVLGACDSRTISTCTVTGAGDCCAGSATATAPIEQAPSQRAACFHPR